MTMIGIAAEDGPEAAAMIDRGPEAHPMSAVLGGLRAPESKLMSPLFYSTYSNLNVHLLVMFADLLCQSLTLSQTFRRHATK